MPLIQTLPAGPLDIVGDIHGEIDALLQLVERLGYRASGQHPQGRHLVFVGDYCDRGPDSPAVFAHVRRWIEGGHAWGVLGNHEINLLRADIKDGSGWFFDERLERDTPRYAPFARPAPEDCPDILRFARQLPLILERGDLRIVHAAWHAPSIAAVRALGDVDVVAQYDAWEELAHERARRTGLDRRMADELARWGHDLEDPEHTPHMLAAHAEHEADKQSMNPLKVLTSGLEALGQRPFYAGGRWRFVDRQPWWNDYTDDIPVVVGHYWRRVRPVSPAVRERGYMDLFEGAPPDAWLGPRGQVFCVDYSVGGRWIERKAGDPVGQEFKLAALRWPEGELLFDDGSRLATRPGRPAVSTS